MSRARRARHRAAPSALSVALMAALAALAPVELGATSVGDAALRAVAFADLPGWEADDHPAALATFRTSCVAILGGAPSLRPAGATGEALLAACRAGIAAGPAEARAFFEAWFVPHRVIPPSGAGFMTGYFEPVLEGALVPSAEFSVPLRGRPEALVSILEHERLPGIPDHLRAALDLGGAAFAPVPTRAAIEEGALDGAAEPIVWLREPGEAFIVHVQGSARIRLPDGRLLRVGYAGRNGHPYVSIGRLLVERGAIAREEMSLERLLAWLAQNRDAARALMRENPSYIFFRTIPEDEPALGPIGGAGVPLAPERSIAVDRALWRYGLPFHLAGRVPDVDGRLQPLARLMIAQDTGSAIVGPARIDYFVGTGPEAGTRAGLMRHAVDVTVLLPRPAPIAASEPGRAP